MRNAETVLTIVRERGTRGLPLEDVYRMLYNPDLYLRAYGRLYKNEGAMTKGTSDETVDGMELPNIDQDGSRVMAARRRKTLVVCRFCHQAIHAGQPTRQKRSD